MQDRDDFRRTWLDKFFANSDEWVTVIEPSGRIAWTSPSLAMAMGYTADELNGRSAFDLLHPSDVDRLALNLDRRFGLDGDDQGTQVRLLTSEGAEIDALLTARVLNEHDNQPVLAVRIHEQNSSSRVTHELRARLLVDDVIREARRRLRNADRDEWWSEVAPQLIDQAARLVGADCAWFMLQDPHHPDGVRRIDWVAEGTALSDSAVFTELGHAENAFEPIWIDASHPPSPATAPFIEKLGCRGALLVPIGTEAHHRGVLGVAVSRNDVSWSANDIHLLQSIADLVDDATTLNLWRDRFELAFNHAPLGVTLLRFGANGCVLDVNEKHRELTGLPDDLVIGSPVEAIDPLIVRGRDWREKLESDGYAEFETCFPTPAAEGRTLRCHVAAQRIDGELRLGVVHTEDVTERLHLAEQLEFAASHDR